MREECAWSQIRFLSSLHENLSDLEFNQSEFSGCVYFSPLGTLVRAAVTFGLLRQPFSSSAFATHVTFPDPIPGRTLCKTDISVTTLGILSVLVISTIFHERIMTWKSGPIISARPFLWAGWAWWIVPKRRVYGGFMCRIRTTTTKNRFLQELFHPSVMPWQIIKYSDS